jgi:hypothetical protein
LDRDELIFGIVLVVILLGVSAYFSRQQWLTLKRLRTESPEKIEDRHFLRAQAYRRLVCCGLMVLFAGLLVGSWFLEPEYQRLIHDPRPTDEPAPKLHPDDRFFLRFFTFYWVFALLVMVALFFVAFFDLRAILREGYRKHRQLREAQKAVLEEEVRQYRKEGNGHI